MNCSNCNADNVESSRFCSQCGAALTWEHAAASLRKRVSAPATSSGKAPPSESSPDGRRDFSANEETIEYEPPQQSTRGDRQRHEPAELVVGNAPQLSGEIETVLRRRLRGATLVLFVAHAAFSIFFLLVDVPHYPAPPFLNAYHAFVVVFLAACGGVLFSRRPIPLRTLRKLELLIFGTTAGNFVLLDYVSIMECAPKGFVQNPASYWITLILLYGIFIPNTWRRATVVASGMFCVSLMMTVFLRLRYDFVAQALSWVQVTWWAMQELVCCAGAVIGAHLISTLRRQAFEAKQLGQYRLKRLIGSGGMGQVYLAEHRLLKRPCAIKVIRPGKAADPMVLARFEQEIHITAGLSHPNTVEVYDHGRTEDGTFYYVMEYLPGLSLAQLVDHCGPLPAARVVYLLKQVCGALREAHGLGLVHRDIKPENIFAAIRGGLYDVAKLLDFGLVKPNLELRGPSLTQEGTLAGSPSYMSPEQAKGDRDPDIRSDIYSLGAAAYFLLTGRPPFDRDTPMQVLFAHACDDVVSPSQIHADVPPDLERVVLRCLAKNPDERFQDAESLQAAFVDCESNGGWTQTEANRWWEESTHAAAVAYEETPGKRDSPSPQTTNVRH